MVSLEKSLTTFAGYLKGCKASGKRWRLWSPEKLQELQRALSLKKASQPPSPQEPQSSIQGPTNDMQTEDINPPGKKELPTNPPFILPEGPKEAQWAWLKERVLNCPVCKSKVKPGKQVVFGVGNLSADIFFCGEAPGAEEETLGEPFVGSAGQLLNKIIAAMGLKREDTYIGNIMNWRPEMPTPYGNRPPTQAEMEFCLPYLQAQVSIVQPKVIVALGATATSGLLGADPKRRMGKVRGTWGDFSQIPVMITFHPSYLLHNDTLQAKRAVWEDMLAVMEKIHLPISEKQRQYFTQ